MNTPTSMEEPTQDSSVISSYLTPTQQPTQSPKYLTDFQPKKMEDQFGLSNTGRYTLDDLESDPEFVARAERFMESIGTDEEIFEYLRDTDFSLSSAIARAGQIKGWSEEAKADYNYLRTKFDNADIGSTRQYLNLAGDMTVDFLADPINWLSVAFFVPSGGFSAATGLAAKEVAKKGLKQIAKDV